MAAILYLGEWKKQQMNICSTSEFFGQNIKMGAEIQTKLVDPDDGWQGKLPRALKRKDRVGGSAVNNYELNREKKKTGFSNRTRTGYF